MVWLAVDRDGTEVIYEDKPHRKDNEYWENVLYTYYIRLPEGTIKKLIGRDLTWDDEPVELK